MKFRSIIALITTLAVAVLPIGPSPHLCCPDPKCEPGFQSCDTMRSEYVHVCTFDAQWHIVKCLQGSKCTEDKNKPGNGHCGSGPV
ncbi:hypothetical protein EK21DRAFT_108908 [Setomelanomma holmii]|uniref:Extracellular membrane protein CFEM domain-containing protein n=1 Tax=Setomelanomma holmii TaxID=210430 RepID=A0A9P4HH21_9PLEO|nr:hypothetical protein EK21DRAFT_108908 [Setomelanomma holmii]